jgi:hypothetical protein
MSTPLRFTPADLPNQTGRTAIVTGASSGLGELLAEHLRLPVPTSSWPSAVVVSCIAGGVPGYEPRS